MQALPDVDPQEAFQSNSVLQSNEIDDNVHDVFDVGGLEQTIAGATKDEAKSSGEGELLIFDADMLVFC